MKVIRYVVRVLLYFYPLVLLAIFWEFIARSGLVRPLFLPPLSALPETAEHLYREGALLAPLAISLYRAFAGLALALLIGSVVGIAMSRSRALRWFAEPLVAVAFPAPKLAFLPVFVLWFGLGHLTKILLVAFSCVFPIIIGFYNAANAVSPVLIWSAQSMGASELNILRRVLLPACVPALFATIRINLPVALIITFTAEMIVGGKGLGDDLTYAQRMFDTPTVYVYILVMLAIGLLVDNVILWTRRRVLGWYEENEPGDRV